MDETRTKSGLNGRNNDFVHRSHFITSSKTRVCDWLISSVISLIGHFVHKNDGVSFRDFNLKSFCFRSFRMNSFGSNVFKINRLNRQM